MPRNKANNQYFAEALEIKVWEKLSNFKSVYKRRKKWLKGIH